jgi:hypothetical protein
MNTSTRATFKDANHAHASTACGPLLRPEGVIMPSTTTSQTAFGAGGAGVGGLGMMGLFQFGHCATLAACYREALNNPKARLPVTPALISSARAWLMEQYAAVVALGYWPTFLNGPQPLERALAAFEQPAADGEPCTLVPISSDNNGPHPVWTPIENLLFRFVHDYAHHVIGAPATFAGELAVARHTLTPEVRADEPLARFLASESVGQVALSIVSGTYPNQVIAAGILDLI